MMCAQDFHLNHESLIRYHLESLRLALGYDLLFIKNDCFVSTFLKRKLVPQ